MVGDRRQQGPDANTRVDSGAGPFPAGSFARSDDAPDGRFYDQPRFVQHIDAGAIAAVTDAVRRHVAPGSDLLDLMSSWVSHLPPAAELPLGRVVGLGLNAEELAANPRLDAWSVHDLNADPRLPDADATFDAVAITVSFQYLTDPVAVLRDVSRVLRPGGVLLVSFSNRMFGTKAVSIWQETPDADRWALVRDAIVAAGGFAAPTVEAMVPERRWFGGGDPLWTVVARRR